MDEQGTGVFNSIDQTPNTTDSRAVVSPLQVLDEKSTDTIFHLLFRDYIEEKKQ